MQKPNQYPRRLQAFKLALEVSGAGKKVTVRDFATRQDCSVELVYQTLANPKKSDKINRAINRVMARHLPDFKVAA